MAICHDLVYLMPNIDLFFLMEWVSGLSVSYYIVSVEAFYRHIGVLYYPNRAQISDIRYISFYFLLYKQVSDRLTCISYWESVPFLFLKQMSFVFVIDTADLYDIPVNIVIWIQSIIIISYYPFD